MCTSFCFLSSPTSCPALNRQQRPLSSVFCPRTPKSHSQNLIGMFRLAPGPWLHKHGNLTPRDEEYCTALGKVIQDNIPNLPDNSGPSFVRHATFCGDSLYEQLAEYNQPGLILYLSNAHKGSSVQSSQSNNAISFAIRTGMLPILVLDHILHACSPEDCDELVPKHPDRPVINVHYTSMSGSHNNWYRELQKAVKIYQNDSKTPANPPPNVVGGSSAKKQFLATLNVYNTDTTPGGRVRRNINQAALTLRAITEGQYPLTVDGIHDIIWRQNLARVPDLTKADVAGAVQHPNIQGMPAALAVAINHTPILLLTDANLAQDKYNKATTILKMWASAGNEHRLDPKHPLGKIERHFWKSLVSLAYNLITVHDFIDSFFSFEIVRELLANEPSEEYRWAIAYISDFDPLANKLLLVMDDDGEEPLQNVSSTETPLLPTSSPVGSELSQPSFLPEGRSRDNLPKPAVLGVPSTSAHAAHTSVEKPSTEKHDTSNDYAFPGSLTDVLNNMPWTTDSPDFSGPDTYSSLFPGDFGNDLWQPVMEGLAQLPLEFSMDSPLPIIVPAPTDVLMASPPHTAMDLTSALAPSVIHDPPCVADSPMEPSLSMPEVKSQVLAVTQLKKVRVTAKAGLLRRKKTGYMVSKKNARFRRVELSRKFRFQIKRHRLPLPAEPNIQSTSVTSALAPSVIQDPPRSADSPMEPPLSMPEVRGRALGVTLLKKALKKARVTTTAGLLRRKTGYMVTNKATRFRRVELSRKFRSQKMQDQLPLPAKSNIQSTSVPDSSPAAPDVEQDIIPHTPPATLPESTGLNLTGSVSCRTRSQTGSLPLPKAQPKKPTESNNSNSGFSDSGSRSRRTGAKSRTTSHYVNLAEPAQQIPEQTRLREYPRLIKNVQRPTSPRSLPMTVYTPKPKIGEFRSQTFEYIMFSKFSSDCQMIENMLATQRANPRGIPQFLSADISRNPDPTIKPGFSQSFLYISTPMDLAKVTLRNQYLLHRHRCVMVLDIGADAPPAFDTKALWRVGDPDMLYLIQGMVFVQFIIS
ncbi:hypothetical protein R3P38DRAFT_1958399 [Favolaschia claudopus]|uniref:Uncharacterized protein n=1 Tax=Favolaschia claudopus TaxID=2862362 RepID=A0AAW0A0C0_9AGAR